MELYKSTGLIPAHIVGYPMSSILEVKMINEGDNLRLVVPRSYFHRLGLERGETLLVTVDEEKRKARRKGRARLQHHHN